MVYKRADENTRTVEEYLHDFERQTGRKLDALDPDTKEGTDFCGVYDIVEYPTVIALSDDSHMQNMWKGLPLPTISEVSYYA